MQPEPVQRSRTRTGRAGEKRARRRAQSSVSGRGMRVGGRARRSRGPNGTVPGGVSGAGAKEGGRTEDVLEWLACDSAVEHVQECSGLRCGVFHPREFLSRACTSDGQREFCEATHGANKPVLHNARSPPRAICTPCLPTLLTCTRTSFPTPSPPRGGPPLPSAGAPPRPTTAATRPRTSPASTGTARRRRRRTAPAPTARRPTSPATTVRPPPALPPPLTPPQPVPASAASSAAWLPAASRAIAKRQSTSSTTKSSVRRPVPVVPLLTTATPEQLKSKPVPDTKPDLPPIPTCKPSPLADPRLTAHPAAEPFSTNDPLFNVPFDPHFPFGSEAANLEYSILSAILGNPSPPDSASGTAPSPSQHPLHPSAPCSTWSPEPLHAQPHYQPAPQQPYPFAEPTRLSIPEPTLAATAHPSPTTAFISYSPTQFSRPSQDSPVEPTYPPPYPPSLPPRYSRDTTTATMAGPRVPPKESLEPSAHPSPSSTSSTHQSSIDHFSVRRPCAPRSSADMTPAAQRLSPVRLHRGLSLSHETSSHPVRAS
jgi:hypothetical protein